MLTNFRFSKSEMRFTLITFDFIDPCCRLVLMESRTGQIAPLLLLVEHFGPIRDAIKSAVAATGIKGKGKRFFHILKPYS